jgi:lysophospholipase L1-like esterase
MMEGLVRVVLCLGAAALLWVGLALFAHGAPAGAATLIQVLFALALFLTYAALVGAVVWASPRPRPALARTAALSLGLLAAWGLMELAAVARLVHWERLFGSAREAPVYVPDPDLGFRHLPYARRVGRPRSDIEVAWGLPASRHDTMAVTYDGRGYRNATDLTRAGIVLIGDSYVEGAYVSDEDTVARRLQSRLRQPVANLGVAGYGTAQELIVLERDALPLDPRVVIWFFFEGNDLYNDQDFENTLLAPREARAWPEPGGWRRSFTGNLLPELRLLLHPLVPASCPHFGILKLGPHRGQKILFGPEAGYPWTAFEWHRWDKARNTLDRAVSLTRALDIRLLLVYVPIKFRVYRDFVDLPSSEEIRGWTLWPLPDLFAQFCRPAGVVCLDLTDPLQEAVAAGGMPYALADSHWSPHGHQLIAARLEQMLASLGWVPPPPPDSASRAPGGALP